MKNRKLGVFTLAWPIFIEIVLFMLMGNIDILMLGRFDEFAVGAVGNANQLFQIIGLLFTIITSAVGILISQSIGARKEKDIPLIVSIAFYSNLVFSVLLSIGLLIFGKEVLSLINVPDEIVGYAFSYMSIVGGFLFIHALGLTLTTTIRTMGRPKVVMVVSLVVNVINVIGNYVFLFGPFNIPVLGVTGVAISTSFSRLLGFVVYYWYIQKHLQIKISLSSVLAWPKDMMIKMIKIGVPTALEPLSYQVGQVVIFSMINLFGIVVINTRLYVQVLAWFVYLAVIAISQALLIVVGRFVGSNQYNEAKKVVFKYLGYSSMIALTMSILLAIFGPAILRMFTTDSRVIALASVIFIIDIFVEQGRVLNVVLVNSMKGAGDVYFPAVLGMIMVWLVSVSLAYVLGVVFNFGLIGIWIGFAADEIIRGLILLYRWHSNAWQKYKWV